MGRRIDLETARRWVDKARAKGKRVVLASGCFDLIHVGHVRYLEAARAQGDVLIVAVNGDRSVASLKGAGRPILSQQQRAELVASLEVVDGVLVFQEPTVRGVIEALRPHVHCKGTDYTAQSVPERDATEAAGGETRIVGDRKTHSTRDLIERVLQRFGSP